jgi:hypothetical protein
MWKKNGFLFLLKMIKKMPNRPLKKRALDGIHHPDRHFPGQFQCIARIHLMSTSGRIAAPVVLFEIGGF